MQFLHIVYGYEQRPFEYKDGEWEASSRETKQLRRVTQLPCRCE